MPIHILSVLKPPKKVLSTLHSLFANFMWSSGSESRHHWVSWDSMCMPLKEATGGKLGFRSLASTMEALHWLLAWHFIEGHSLWASFMRQK